MVHQNTNIEHLISAFAYSFSSSNETFYLRKRDLKVIGVHIFDYSLVSKCKSEYNSGLTSEEEQDVKEVIIANEKRYNTHILIPRLTKEQRFEIMKQFMTSTKDFNKELSVNLQDLVDSTKNYGISFFKKGIKPGVEMEYLSVGIDDNELKSKWREFYRNKTEIIALAWLEKQKDILGLKK
ncbi:hypothetical protein [Flagellimonas sp.]|uniref:hypothetical protein n=1 Tax=Flagellimonas sp. TaxID=2058762 RepID=UPI003B5CB6BE